MNLTVLCHSVLKRILVLIFLLGGNMIVQAQVKIDAQPDTSYYRYIVNTVSPYALAEKETASWKAQPLPDGLLDTLQRYDWVDMGGINYTEGIFKSLFTPFRDLLGADSKQLDFKRYCKDGFVAQFFLQKTRKNIKTVYTTTFDKATATKWIGLKKVKGITYLIQEDFGEKTYTQIVSYANRQLVLDITQYGKIGEKPVKYRVVYFGVEQKFNWAIR